MNFRIGDKVRYIDNVDFKQYYHKEGVVFDINPNHDLGVMLTVRGLGKDLGISWPLNFLQQRFVLVESSKERPSSLDEYGDEW